jgi:cobalt transporter subunit CbtB
MENDMTLTTTVPDRTGPLRATCADEASGIAAQAGTIVAMAAVAAAMLYLAGFAQMASAHGPAHDQRHAIAFPCH